MIGTGIEIFYPAADVSDTVLPCLKVTAEDGGITTIVPGFSFWERGTEKEVEIIGIANTELDSSYWAIVFRPVGEAMSLRTLEPNAFLLAYRPNDSVRWSDYPAHQIEMLACERISIDPISAGLYFNWSAAGVGFGQISIATNDDGYLIQNECMGKNFIKSLLCKLVDAAALDQ
jgi:hypothetical protein